MRAVLHRGAVLSLFFSFFLLPGMSLALQNLPAIPSGIKDQGLLAVLFLVVLGLAFALIIVRSLPAVFAPVISAIDRLIASNNDLRRRVEEGISAAEAMEKQVEAVRQHIHTRLTPSIAGLTIAYLKQAGFYDLADQIEQDNPDAIPPPTPKRRRGEG